MASPERRAERVLKAARGGSLVPGILYVGLALVVVAACLSAMAFFGRYRKAKDQLPFQADGWHAPMTDPEGHFTGTRLRMVDDLLKRYDFHGWSMEDLEALLGDAWLERTVEGKRLLKFDLRDGLNLLIFEIDDQHRVIDYHVQLD